MEKRIKLPPVADILAARQKHIDAIMERITIKMMLALRK